MAQLAYFPPRKRRKRGRATSNSGARAQQPVIYDEPASLQSQDGSQERPSPTIGLPTSSFEQQLSISSTITPAVPEIYQGSALSCDEQPLANDGPKTLESPRNHHSNQRHVGPIAGSDNQALSDLVHTGLGDRSITRTLWTTNAGGLSAPVVFTEARRRPVGLKHDLNTAKANLEIIQKLLEPRFPQVVTL